MKIAIHIRKGSFSDVWIPFCEREKIDFVIVDCYQSNIIEQMKDCSVLLWHYHQNDIKDRLTADRVLFALEAIGIKVYPNFKTSWHFDDKVAQKYLLEAIDAPLVKSYVFYDKNEALTWAEKVKYPKVFKLRGGAGSKNVLLVKNENKCKRLINKAFSTGFSQDNRVNAIIDDWIEFKKTMKLIHLIKIPARFFVKSKFAKQRGKEFGYVYFQDFIPNNLSDTRVVVIGGRAIGERRFVRKNDFRASGSGEFCYDGIDVKTVEIAFDVARKLELQSVAFDFVHDEFNNPLIVEISYGFGREGLSKAPGFWDSDLKWYDKKVQPEEWIIEDLLID